MATIQHARELWKKEHGYNTTCQRVMEEGTWLQYNMLESYGRNMATIQHAKVMEGTWLQYNMPESYGRNMATIQHARELWKEHGYNTTCQRVMEDCIYSFHWLETLEIPTDGRIRILSIILKAVQIKAEENVTDHCVSIIHHAFLLPKWWVINLLKTQFNFMKVHLP
jgi:hypothetical protein